MRKVSATRVARRGRGRPPRDYTEDPDLKVANLAILLKAAGFSERKAFDLALAETQGIRTIASKLPRGSAGKAGIVVGYSLPMGRSFHSRAAAIRRKLKAGKLRPNAEVRALALLLHHLRRRQV